MTWTWGRVLAAFEWTLGVAGFLPICGQANTADFNSTGDPSHGQADLLFQNKSTGLLKVWFMNGASYTREKTITLNGSPWPVTDWQYVGVGRFQPNPAVPAIVWQHLVTRQMAVWWMKSDGTGDLTAIDTTSLFYGGYAPAGWRAVAVGNFDGVGDSDIALQHDTTGQVAFWLMNGVNQILDTAIRGNSPNWRVTGTGDFGAGGSPTTGVKDGKDDLLLTYSDPANDATPPISNLAGIWFMNGTMPVAYKIIQTIVNGVYYNLPISTPDWRLLATGDFDADGRTDAFIRDAVIGRHGIWYSSGHIVQSGTFTKAEPDPAWKLYSQDWLQSVWRHKNLYPSISVTPQASPVRFTLNYRIKPAASGVGVTIRRREENPATGALTGWTTLVSNHPSSTYQDSSSTLQSGVRYEYDIMRTGIFPGGLAEDIHPARIYASVDPAINPLASRGKVLVIVDGSLYANNGISAGLGTYTNDLTGDGWQVVLKVDAPRHDEAYITPTACSESECVLNAIPKPHRSDPNADQVNKTNRENLKTGFIDQHPDAKGIVIVGHVTIPFSGYHGSDNHCDHYGAWVADAWYGHSGTGWTDSNDLQLCAAFPFNSNLVQDGKFDQSLFPSPATEMKRFVGRIDFARLPSFGTGDGPSPAEKNLINAYFAKNHAYRVKAIALNDKVMALSTFDFLNYQGSETGPKQWIHNYVYDHAFRTASALFGSGFDKVVVGDAFHQKTDSYLFGFLSGSGNPDLINENSPDHPTNYPLESNYLTHTTAQLAGGWDAKIGFYLLLGSYLGDWNMTDDFMRAAIATPTYGLAAVWIGVDSKTRWQFHGLAQGEPLGHGFLRTIKDAIPEAGGRLDLDFDHRRSHPAVARGRPSFQSGVCLRHLELAGGRAGLPVLHLPFSQHANSLRLLLRAPVRNERVRTRDGSPHGPGGQAGGHRQRPVHQPQPGGIPMKRACLNALSCLVWFAAPCPAGEFFNLDFEQADKSSLELFEPPSPFVFLGSGRGRTADLLPGWSLTSFGQPLELLWFNYPPFSGGSYATLFDKNYNSNWLADGEYGFLQEGNFFQLSQRGEIPAEARYLTYSFSGNGFEVSINGEVVDSAFPSFGLQLKHLDIARFAGQEVELTFKTVPAHPFGGGSKIATLDGIAFTAIPEPSTYALLTLGASVLGGRWLWQRRKALRVSGPQRRLP